MAEALDTVAATEQEVVVTKRGRPVARVVSVVGKPKPIVGATKGIVQIVGDIASPLPMPWSASNARRSA